MIRSSETSVAFRTAAVLVLACLLPGAPAAAQSTDPAEWLADVDYLLAAMDSIHPAPYRKTSREGWESAARQLKARLPGLRYHEAVAGIARLVALAADGHTRLGQVRLADHEHVELELLPGGGFETEYPVMFEIFADGLYAVRASERHADLFGKRIVAVNGLPIAEVIDRLRPYISADNEIWVLYLAPQYLRSPAYIHVAGVATNTDAALVLTAEDGAGRRIEVSVAPEAASSPVNWIEAESRLGTNRATPLYRRLTDNYDFVYLEEARAVYMRYREVQNMPGESIAQFAQRLFAFVDSADVDRLIIDVRRNGGGNNYLNQPLVHGLIKSEKVNQPGKLFVITDRGTFSAAISFVGDVEGNAHALFVGEPTGSPINQYGDSRKVTLPTSGLIVRISELYWQLADPRDPRPWVIPDLPAPLTFADYVAGRDPALEAILDYEYESGTLPAQPNRNWRRPSQLREPAPLVRW